MGVPLSIQHFRYQLWREGEETTHTLSTLLKTCKLTQLPVQHDPLDKILHSWRCSITYALHRKFCTFYSIFKKQGLQQQYFLYKLLHKDTDTIKNRSPSTKTDFFPCHLKVLMELKPNAHISWKCLIKMQTGTCSYLKHYYVLVKHLPPALHIMIVINLKQKSQTTMINKHHI